MKRRFMILFTLAITATLLHSGNLARADKTTLSVAKHDGKPADMTKPVQVFILLGQSNMVGLGKVTGAEISLVFVGDREVQCLAGVDHVQAPYLV